MKKSLKKSLFILLTLLSVFFIVACGNKLSKKEVIEKFIESDKNIKKCRSNYNYENRTKKFY